MNKIVIYIVLALVFGATIFFLSKNIQSKNKEIKKLNNDIGLLSKYNKSSSIENNLANNKIDSLFTENTTLATFETLTRSMIYRDSTRKFLKHNVGEIVLLKPDSSKAVIKDILVGGGKYEYYIKYQVLKKDNSVELLSPEMIF